MKIDLIIGIIAFVVISIFLYIFYMHKIKISTKKTKKKKRKENKEIIEIKYLMISYNLKKEKLLRPSIILLISILDALIISTVFVVIQLLPWAIIWKLLVGFVLLMGLIYSIYNILGRILVKKGFGE